MEDAEDDRREAEEEWLMAVMVKNVRDMAYAEASYSRVELRGVGRSLSSLLSVGTKSWVEFPMSTLTFQTLVDAELREEVHHLGE